MQCDLQEGMSILARGRLGVYVRRGQFRLNVSKPRSRVKGRLRREFLVLMRKLSEEGLFDERVKRLLPAYPDRVGLITSLEGAAIRDVVTNLTRRFGGIAPGCPGGQGPGGRGGRGYRLGHGAVQPLLARSMC